MNNMEHISDDMNNMEHISDDIDQINGEGEVVENIVSDSTDLHDVMVNIKCEIGSVTIDMDQLSRLRVGSIFPFGLVSDTVTVLVNNKRFASGFFVDSNVLFGVIIIHIV